MNKPANCIIVGDEPVVREILENHPHLIHEYELYPTQVTGLSAKRFLTSER